MLNVEWTLKIFPALLHALILILQFAEFINPRDMGD